jgi:cell division septation protein DedD
MQKMRKLLFSFSILLAVMVQQAEAAKKIAFVIGINDYKEIPKLEKAVGDAQAIAQTLSGLGYSVTTALDMDRRGLNLALSKFYASIEPGDTVLVHYSGHGIQIENDNYLLPADVPAPDDGNVELLKSESLRLLTLVDTLGEKGAGARILIIDACRDNPFAAGGKRSIGGTRGLANVATAKGTFIMYSAGAGQSALDRLGESDPEATSVYTRVLLSRLSNPGIKLRDLAASVRDEVEQMGKTIGHDQRPAYYDDLPADFALAPAGTEVQPQQVDPPKIMEQPPQKQDNGDEARLAWDAVKDMTSAAAFDTVAKRYAGTLYGDLAAARADELRAEAKKLEAKKKPQQQANLETVEEPPPVKKTKPTPKPPTRASGANLSQPWAVFLGAFPHEEASKARSRLKAARNNGLQAVLIDTTDYERLTPGLYAVVMEADSRGTALSLADYVREFFPDVYAKQVQ